MSNFRWVQCGLLLLIVVASSAQRTTLIGGNWKCNGNVELVNKLIDILNNAGSIYGNTEVVIAAPSLHLATLTGKLRNDIMISAEVRMIIDYCCIMML